MKIGVKAFPDNREYLKQLASKTELDFVEIMAVQGEDFSFLKKLGLPVVVHCEHFEFGVNLADAKRNDKNRAAIHFAMDTADAFDSRFIVLHPGVKEKSACSLDNTINTVKGLDDKRIIMENMPFRYGPNGTFRHVGSSFEEMKSLMSATGKGMCLDLGHVNTVAFNKGVDAIGLVKKFMELRPAYFHMSDNKGPTDIHTSLGEGSMDIDALKKAIAKQAKNPMVAIETVINLEKQINDISMMRGGVKQ